MNIKWIPLSKTTTVKGQQTYTIIIVCIYEHNSGRDAYEEGYRKDSPLNTHNTLKS